MVSNAPPLDLLYLESSREVGHFLSPFPVQDKVDWLTRDAYCLSSVHVDPMQSPLTEKYLILMASVCL